MEQEKPQVQINLDPNAYTITMVNMGFDEELFHMLIASGNQAKQYNATPKHAKRILLLLQKQIEEYENKFGEIKTQLPEKPKTTQNNNKVGF